MPIISNPLNYDAPPPDYTNVHSKFNYRNENANVFLKQLFRDSIKADSTTTNECLSQSTHAQKCPPLAAVPQLRLSHKKKATRILVCSIRHMALRRSFIHCHTSPPATRFVYEIMKSTLHAKKKASQRLQ